MSPDQNQNPYGIQPPQYPGQPQPDYPARPQQLPQPQYPGQPPAPQPMQPQPGQYQPYPTVPQVPPPAPPAKSNKKLLIILIALGLVLSAGIVTAVLLMGEGNKKPPGTGYEITKPFDSPAGFVQPFRTSEVSGGTFKLSANYVTGGSFERQGSFFVEDGKISFEMLPDDTRVNQFIRTVYVDHGRATGYSDQSQGATRNFSYDFNSLMGYNFLYDPNTKPYGGFVAAIERARADPAYAKDKAVKLTDARDAALKDVKAKTGASITTTGVVFDTVIHEGHPQASINLASRQASDTAVTAFLDGCFDLANPSLKRYRDVVNGIRDNTTPSPVFTYYQDGDKYKLTIQVPDPNSVNDPELKFEFSNINAPTQPKSGTTAPYIEKRNLFGLTYSLCRVEPVVARADSYRFFAEATDYLPPSESDEGYYCRTLDVPPQYVTPASLTTRLPSGATLQATADEIDEQRAVHDLMYQIEKYNLDKQRYPGPTEYTDLVGNNMGSLADISQAAVRARRFIYAGRPEKCIGDCKSFLFKYVANPGFFLDRKAC